MVKHGGRVKRSGRIKRSGRVKRSGQKQSVSKKRQGKTKKIKTKNYSRKRFYKRSGRSKRLIGGEMRNMCMNGHPCPLEGENSSTCTICGGACRMRDISSAWTGRVIGDGDSHKATTGSEGKATKKGGSYQTGG